MSPTESPVTETTPDVAEQYRLTLTPHPLQRIGAYALAALVESTPADLTADRFRAAVERMTGDAVRASVRESKAPDGFWQKASLSFFPNAPMNHPGRYKGKNEKGEPKTARDVQEATRRWLSLPDPATWPDADCALCGRRAVGWYGKQDMPLAESQAYRNTTPRGHEGTALCHPCLCSFRALPYGSQLTGGTSTALHSWDERFTAYTVGRRADLNAGVAATGAAPAREHAREVVALKALRGYAEPLRAGVDLLVFNNNNRGQVLERHHLDQPLAEWLSGRHAAGPGFRVLVRAHATARTSGYVALGRNAFRAPERILGTSARWLLRAAAVPELREDRRSLSALLRTFAEKVMQVQEKDLAEIRAVARKLAYRLSKEESWSGLKQLRMHLREPAGLRRWLTSEGITWACLDPEGSENGVKKELEGPLVSERAYLLLLDPSPNSRAWLHRDLLLVGVLEELDRLGWHLKGDRAEEAMKELHRDTNDEDNELLSDEEGKR
ncbi:hypothetical protein GCM10027160_33960 [Streptomyces calidiresistens]|uniref:Type I-B CRISPR-associated protein Cas8b1/Cst1 n=1 Tax=Streptomyces calidiresistens TaxID=1485586 RepID=A0A7W3T040_9ACTN|nr:hypothetical protein [Streptomyces calidiresistens]MBB0228373.1 hypothetical protein [Streptomyces calidiresistens]